MKPVCASMRSAMPRGVTPRRAQERKLARALELPGNERTHETQSRNPAVSQYRTRVMTNVRSKMLIDSSRTSALERIKSAWRPAAAH